MNNSDLSSLLPTVHWNDWIPVTPTAKQLVFLSLENTLEVFYGGAGGGGKTAAILMAGLQFVHVPGYSSIVFRKTLTQLKQPKSPLNLSFEWAQEAQWFQRGAHWDGDMHRWTFPCVPYGTASLNFGFLGEFASSNRYKSAEFASINFDEVSEQEESDYLYLFSRLRKVVCPVHLLDEQGKPNYIDGCPTCEASRIIPLRMRAASNPPRSFDPGVTWLKKRFGIKEFPSTTTGSGKIFRGTHPERIYIPAFAKDNPHLEQEGYLKSLEQLDPVTREQMLSGDWDVAEEGRFKRIWRREYVITAQGQHVTTYDIAGRIAHTWTRDQCTIIQTVDTASSKYEGPGDVERYKKMHSDSVISTFMYTPNYDLLWLDCEIFDEEIPGVIARCLRSYKRHKPLKQYIEAISGGLAIYQLLSEAGINVESLSPYGRDKIQRSAQAAVRMEQGRIFFPRDGIGEGERIWLPDVERQVFTWQGHDKEASDIVDTLSYAGIIVSELATSSNEHSAAPFVLSLEDQGYNLHY